MASQLIIADILGCNSARPYRLRNGIHLLNVNDIQFIEDIPVGFRVVYKNLPNELALEYTMRDVDGFFHLENLPEDRGGLAALLVDGEYLLVAIDSIKAIPLPNEMAEEQIVPMKLYFEKEKDVNAYVTNIGQLLESADITVVNGIYMFYINLVEQEYTNLFIDNETQLITMDILEGKDPNDGVTWIVPSGVCFVEVNGVKWENPDVLEYTYVPAVEGENPEPAKWVAGFRLITPFGNYIWQVVVTVIAIEA
jgi:hypothetical protein